MERGEATNPAQFDDIDRRFGAESKARLQELVGFAQTYRGWTSRELAAFLHRDVHNVIPRSGVPKSDLILRLARALDWPASTVLDEVCGESMTPAGDSAGEATGFAELNRLAFAAFSEGRFEEMIALALRMRRVAASPAERGEACLREYGGWDGLGRYEKALAATQRGLGEMGLAPELRLRLRANLSSVYYALGQLAEGEGVATTVVDRIETEGVSHATWQGILATALYVRGECRRSQAILEPDDRERLARAASIDLLRSERAWREYAARFGIENYAAAAYMCRGAGIVANVMCGERSVADALEELLAGLDPTSDPSTLPSGWWLEAYGWWCVFGAELALVAADACPGSDRMLAIFTNKGHELADASGHWALRERIVTLEFTRLTRTQGTHVDPESTTLDRDDVRMLAGIMARFPAFRPLGWELVRRSRRIG